MLNNMLQKPQSITSFHDCLRIESQNDWYKRFEGILDRHNDQIGGLINGLDIEVKAREKGEDSLSRTISGYTDQLKSVDKTLTWLKGASGVIGGLLSLIGVIGISIAAAWILKWLGLK